MEPNTLDGCASLSALRPPRETACITACSEDAEMRMLFSSWLIFAYRIAQFHGNCGGLYVNIVTGTIWVLPLSVLEQDANETK